MQGKKQELRLESLAALEKVIREVLTILGLMPASYSEVCKCIMTRPEFSKKFHLLTKLF